MGFDNWLTLINHLLKTLNHNLLKNSALQIIENSMNHIKIIQNLSILV